jgi:BirA family biotin operon repressor/biotin-[acetyl-CoA-carboxylase] ligase
MAEQNQQRPGEGGQNRSPFRFMVDYQFGDALPTFSKPHFQWKLLTDYMGRRFVYRPVAESTMDDARRMLERMRLTPGAVILADSQTAGRGRNGRTWVSPPDVNLYFTFLLFPEPRALRPLAYVTPLAVAAAIEEVSAAAGKKVVPELKWPNDVLVQGLKIAGVLIEVDHLPDRLAAIVGVGINVNLEPDEFEEISGIATSIKAAVGESVPREEILAAFCNHFESLYEEALSGSLRPFEAWRDRLVTIGRNVVTEVDGISLAGRAVDVAEDGALIIERADGRRERIEAGDVVLTQA